MKLRTENVAVKVLNLFITLTFALQPIPIYAADQITTSPVLAPTVSATSTQTTQEQPVLQQTDANFLSQSQPLSAAQPLPDNAKQAIGNDHFYYAINQVDDSKTLTLYQVDDDQNIVSERILVDADKKAQFIPDIVVVSAEGDGVVYDYLHEAPDDASTSVYYSMSSYHNHYLVYYGSRSGNVSGSGSSQEEVIVYENLAANQATVFVNRGRLTGATYSSDQVVIQTDSRPITLDRATGEDLTGEPFYTPDGSKELHLTQDPSNGRLLELVIKDVTTAQTIRHNIPFLASMTGLTFDDYSADKNWVIAHDAEGFVYAFHLNDDNALVRNFQTRGLDPSFVLEGAAQFDVKVMRFRTDNPNLIDVELMNGEMSVMYLDDDEFRYESGLRVISANTAISISQLATLPGTYQLSGSGLQQTDNGAIVNFNTTNTTQQGLKIAFAQPTDLSGMTTWPLRLSGSAGQVMLTFETGSATSPRRFSVVYLTNIQDNSGTGAIVDMAAIAAQGVDLKYVNNIWINAGNPHAGGNNGWEQGQLAIDFTKPTPITQPTVYVTANSVAESRTTISDFIALLAQKGITQFTQAEVESLINVVPDHTFVGKFYLSVQDGKAAVMVSGEHHHFTCTVSGGISHCTMDGIVGPFTNVLYKPTPTSTGIRKNSLDSLGGTIAMGFTPDGLLVINYGYAQATAIDQQGQTKVLADRVFVENNVQINSFTSSVNVNVVTLSGKVANFDPTKQKLILSLGFESIDMSSRVQADGTFSFSFTRNASTLSAYLYVNDLANNPLQYAERTGIVISQSTTINSFSHAINGNQITFNGQLSNFNAQYQKLVFVFGSSALTQTTTDITASVLANGSFAYAVTPNTGVYSATIKVVDRNTTVFNELQTRSILNISVGPPSVLWFNANVVGGNQVTINGSLFNFDPTKQKLTLSSSLGGVFVGSIDITSSVDASGYVNYSTTVQTPGFYDATLTIVNRSNNQILNQSTITHVAIVPPAVMTFYGGTLPAGAKIIDIQDGTGDGKWDITVELNQSTTSGQVRYQIISLNTTGANVMRIERIREVDYQNKLVRRSVFSYANSTTTNWQTVSRYNNLNILVSTLRIVTQNGKQYYKLDYTAVSKTDVIIGEVAILTWADLFAQCFLLQG